MSEIKTKEALVEHTEEEIERIKSDVEQLPERIHLIFRDIYERGLHKRAAREVMAVKTAEFHHYVEQNKNVPLKVQNATYCHYGVAPPYDDLQAEIQSFIGSDRTLKINPNETLHIVETPSEELRRRLEGYWFVEDIYYITVPVCHYDSVMLAGSGLLTAQQQAHLVMSREIMKVIENNGLGFSLKDIRGVMGFSLNAAGVAMVEKVGVWFAGEKLWRMKRDHVSQRLRCKFCGEVLLQTSPFYDKEKTIIGGMFQLTDTARENGWSLPFSQHENRCDCPNCENSFLSPDGHLVDSCLVPAEDDIDGQK